MIEKFFCKKSLEDLNEFAQSFETFIKVPLIFTIIL